MPWVDGVHLCDGNACFADAACTAAADAAAGCVAEWPGCRRCTKPVDVHFAGGRQWLDWGGKWKPSANASLHAPANASLPACPGSLLVNDSSYPRASYCRSTFETREFVSRCLPLNCSGVHDPCSILGSAWR